MVEERLRSKPRAELERSHLVIILASFTSFQCGFAIFQSSKYGWRVSLQTLPRLFRGICPSFLPHNPNNSLPPPRPHDTWPTCFHPCASPQQIYISFGSLKRKGRGVIRIFGSVGGSSVFIHDDNLSKQTNKQHIRDFL